jgi:hypothetical protein
VVDGMPWPLYPHGRDPVPTVHIIFQNDPEIIQSSLEKTCYPAFKICAASVSWIFWTPRTPHQTTGSVNFKSQPLYKNIQVSIEIFYLNLLLVLSRRLS